MEKPRIAVVSYSDGSKDPRIIKQIYGLMDFADITFIGFNAPKKDLKVKFKKIHRPEKLKRNIFQRGLSLALSIFSPSMAFFKHPLHKNLGNILQNNKFDLILVSDMAMPSCVKYRNEAKVVFDAHEYYLDYKSSLKFILTTKRNIKSVLKKYTKDLSGFITVSNGLADLYTEYFYKRPELIYNSVWYANLAPKLKNVNKDRKIKLIHHGGAWYRRKTQDLIYMMSLVDDRFELDLMLVHISDQYKKFLLDEIEKYKVPVRIIDPVPLFEVSKKLNEYDIGVHRIDGDVSNHKFAMPNKIFEFVQGRLALVTSPNPDMRDFIQSNAIGMVSEDYSIESMAKVLNNLSLEVINEYKKNSDKVAKIYNAEKAQEEYLQVVIEALNKK